MELPVLNQIHEGRDHVYYETVGFCREQGEIWASSIVHSGFQTLSYPKDCHRVAVNNSGLVEMLVSDKDIIRVVRSHAKSVGARMDQRYRT